MTAGSSTEQAPQTLDGTRRLWVASATIGLAVLVLLLAAAVIPLAVAARQGVFYNVGQVATFLPIAAVGFMVAWHRPANPIGWLLIVTAAGALLTVDGQLYAWLVYRLGHHLPFGPAALLLAFAWLTTFVTLPLAILLFPDGVLPARWRWMLWAYIAVTGFLVVSGYIAVVSVMAAHDVRIDASGGLAALDSRSGGTAWLSPVRAVIFPILVVFWLSFIARLLLSWRHASIERRQQLKWLLTGCVITLASGVLSIAAVPAAFRSTAAFAARLKDTVNLRSVQDDLATVVDQALEPARVFVWTNEPE
jgi:two-component system NarL family sensor kinase